MLWQLLAEIKQRSGNFSKRFVCFQRARRTLANNAMRCACVVCTRLDGSKLYIFNHKQTLDQPLFSKPLERRIMHVDNAIKSPIHTCHLFSRSNARNQMKERPTATPWDWDLPRVWLIKRQTAVRNTLV